MARSQIAPSNIPETLEWLDAISSFPSSHVPTSSPFEIFSSNQQGQDYHDWNFVSKQLAPSRKHPSYAEHVEGGFKLCIEGADAWGDFGGLRQEKGQERDWEEHELNAMLAKTWQHVPKNLQEDVKAFSRTVRERLDALTLELVLKVKEDSIEPDEKQVPGDESRCYVLSAAEKRTLKDSLKAKFGHQIAAADADLYEKDRNEPLPPAARAEMKAEYAHEMYPSTAWKQALATKYSLTNRQVNDWFNNERKRRPHPGGAGGKVAAAGPRRAPRRGPRVSLAESEDDASD
ncbi:hypothetical protein KFL_001130160 [Klebsormidium nitens]|uniref:Homeobox domain-containing protein n=1 Tax=Klebsormidium nitens TaxID=105231 RepID=A0A0U9HJL0_KLENI|nr:hypothetical protein KFL_001130160 [Klebsormidium nitens]|eukprot:GAQ82497.1 hypothetical protein KFL_001130160 [Klebsormidium nitens]